MARGDFAATSSYLKTPVTIAYPFTFTGWLYYTGASSYVTLMGSIANTEAWYLRLTPTAGDSVILNVGGSPVSVTTAATGTPGTGWNHVGCTFLSSTGRSTWLNGAGKVTNTTFINASELIIDELQVGGFDNGAANYAIGYAAEVGLWNATLSDGEMEALGKGYSCHLIRPNNLVRHFPLVRGLSDVTTGATLTPSGAEVPVVTHPRIIRSLPV